MYLSHQKVSSTEAGNYLFTAMSLEPSTLQELIHVLNKCRYKHRDNSVKIVL